MGMAAQIRLQRGNGPINGNRERVSLELDPPQAVDEAELVQELRQQIERGRDQDATTRASGIHAGEETLGRLTQQRVAWPLPPEQQRL